MSTVKKEVAAVRTDTEAIRDDTANIPAIMQDTAHIKSLVQQIGFLRLQLERASLQDDRDLPLRRFLDQSTSIAESIADPFGDEMDPFHNVPEPVASSEAGSARRSIERSAAEESPEIAHITSFTEPQRAELHPDSNPRTDHNRLAHRAKGSIGPGTSQSSATQLPEATLMVSSLIDEADDMSMPDEPRTVLRGKIRRDEQAVKATASRRSLLTEKQKNELDRRLAGELTGSIPSIDNYYYIGEDNPKENAPDYLVATLLDLGADVNGTINTGRSLLQAEMSKASPRSTVVRLLLTRGATLDQFTARQLLLCAIFLSGVKGKIAKKFAEVALNNGVSPSMRIEQADVDETLRFHVPTWALLDCSVVTYGACSAATGVLQLLLARGATLDQADARRTLFLAARLEEVQGLNLAQFALANGAEPDNRIESSDVRAWPAYDVTVCRESKIGSRTGTWWKPTHYFENQSLKGYAPSDMHTDTRIPTHYFQYEHIGWTPVKYAIQCRYQLKNPRKRFHLDEKWRVGNQELNVQFTLKEWTFIKNFVQLLTTHGGSYEPGVLTFVVNQEAWDQLDWVLPWKQSTYATAEVGTEILTLACQHFMDGAHGARKVDRVAIVRSIIASGAVLTDLEFSQTTASYRPRWEATHAVEVLRFYETERQKRLQVNRRAPGTYTDAQCRAVPGSDQRIVQLEGDIRRQAEREQQEKADVQRAQERARARLQEQEKKPRKKKGFFSKVFD